MGVVLICFMSVVLLLQCFCLGAGADRSNNALLPSAILGVLNAILGLIAVAVYVMQ